MSKTKSYKKRGVAPKDLGEVNPDLAPVEGSKKDGFINWLHVSIRTNGMVFYFLYLISGVGLFWGLKQFGLLDFDKVSSIIPSLVGFLIWGGSFVFSMQNRAKEGMKGSVARWIGIVGAALGIIAAVFIIPDIIKDIFQW